MARFFPIAVQVDGRRYTGDWTLIQGGRICVRSAFGSTVVEIGTGQPDPAARRALQEIVAGYRAAQAEGRQRQERALAELRGKQPRSPAR